MIFQSIVFLYAFSLVSGKMSFDGFETDAQEPLSHTKKFSSIHEKHSQSQNYAFSSQSSSSFTQTKTSEENGKIIEQTGSFDAISAQEALKTSKENTQQTNNKLFPTVVQTTKNYPKQNTESGASNTVSIKNNRETYNSENTTNATIKTNDVSNQTEIDNKSNKEFVSITGSDGTDKNNEVENTTEATTTSKEFQKVIIGTVETIKKRESHIEYEEASETTIKKSENINSVTLAQSENSHSTKPTTTDKGKKNQFILAQASEKEAKNADHDKAKSLTVTQASDQSAQRATNVGSEAKTKNVVEQASYSKSHESTTSENTNHTSVETSNTYAHKIAADRKKPKQLTTTMASDGKSSTQRETSTGSDKKNELIVTQASSTNALKVATEDDQAATKPAESEATLNRSNKDKKQNVYTSDNRDTKSIFAKREEEHKTGRYDFKQMDGAKAIHNAIQMDFNYKMLLVEDGSAPGKCYCTCDMNSRPVFMTLDSESIPS